MTGEHIHFVTGRLAEPALRTTVERLAASLDFGYSIDVLPITVAALMSTKWVARHLQVPAGATRVVLPGYCGGDLESVAAAAAVPVERGPKDLRQLPAYFGQRDASLDDYGAVRHRDSRRDQSRSPPSLAEILEEADRYRSQGADIIDVGCEPGDPWPAVADCVRALRDAGHRVSIDSFEPREVASAVEAGAELVLSVNSGNREAACDWGCEVVVIPDEFQSFAGFR